MSSDVLSEERSAHGRPLRVLLVSSGGGHWVQLLRLRPAFDGCEMNFVCVRPQYHVDVPGRRFFSVNDATRWNKFGLALMATRVLIIVLRVRPDVVVSTGAAPGYFAVRFGKLFGARTAWVDTISNAEHISMSAKLVERFADLWLTQWPHLAKPDGPYYVGAVL
jgi:hypothetical protein